MNMIPFLIFLIIVILIMLFPCRKMWLRYTKLAKLKPDEKILYEEDNVKIIEDAVGELIGEGGSSGRGWGKATVKITNQRILQFKGKVPLGIVNYYGGERQIKSWLYFYRGYLLNIHKEDISFSVDDKGSEYLEVTSKQGKGVIKRKYYFNNMTVVKEQFK